MNTNLLNALKEIVSRHGGVETLSDARRVKALLADLAASEPKPQKNALIACLERDFAAMLQNVPVEERGAAKTKLAEHLNREEGLDAALCADTLDLLEAALFGNVSPKPEPNATEMPGTSAPQKPEEAAKAETLRIATEKAAGEHTQPAAKKVEARAATEKAAGKKKRILPNILFWIIAIVSAFLGYDLGLTLLTLR
jgi:hypothetical protein